MKKRRILNYFFLLLFTILLSNNRLIAQGSIGGSFPAPIDAGSDPVACSTEENDYIQTIRIVNPNPPLSDDILALWYVFNEEGYFMEVEGIGDGFQYESLLKPGEINILAVKYLNSVTGDESPYSTFIVANIISDNIFLKLEDTKTKKICEGNIPAYWSIQNSEYDTYLQQIFLLEEMGILPPNTYAFTADTQIISGYELFAFFVEINGITASSQLDSWKNFFLPESSVQNTEVTPVFIGHITDVHTQTANILSDMMLGVYTCLGNSLTFNLESLECPNIDPVGVTYFPNGSGIVQVTNPIYDHYQWFKIASGTVGEDQHTHITSEEGVYYVEVSLDDPNVIKGKSENVQVIKKNIEEQSNAPNYVSTIVVQKEGVNTLEQIEDLSLGEYKQQTMYLDGLGREMQSVITQGSYNGNDIIEFYDYDQYGRQTYSYLPYVSSSQSGYYRPNASMEQRDYYNPTGGTYTIDRWNNSSNLPETRFPFSETVFENSPLNRTLEQGNIGKDWQPRDVSYDAYAENWSVSNFTTSAVSSSGSVNASLSGNILSLTFSAGFSSTTLKTGYVQKMNVMAEYAQTKFPDKYLGLLGTHYEVSLKGGYIHINSLNNVPASINGFGSDNLSGTTTFEISVAQTRKTIKVQQRVNVQNIDKIKIFQVGTGAWNSSNILQVQGLYDTGELLIEETEDVHGNKTLSYIDKSGNTICRKKQDGRTSYLDTYYVYDDFGDLRYVLPPKAIKVINNNIFFVWADIEPYAFAYKYDGYRRTIFKKVPGAGFVETVYDKKFQPVLTQDANQREKNEWSFIKYDNLNRPIMIGLTKAEKLVGENLIPYTRAELQAQADGFGGLNYEEKTTYSGNHYYTINQSYPDLTSYDDYSHFFTYVTFIDGFTSGSGGITLSINNNVLQTQFSASLSSPIQLKTGDIIKVNTTSNGELLDLPDMSLGAIDVYNTKYSVSIKNGYIHVESLTDPKETITSFNNNKLIYLGTFQQMEIHTISYYDDYDFDEDNNADVSFDASQIAGLSSTERLLGMMTGSKTFILDVVGTSLPKWLQAVSFYDKRGRIIQTQGDNQTLDGIIQGRDIATTQYDPVGKILNTVLVHQNPNLGENIIVRNRIEYNHQRAATHYYQKVNDEEEVLLSEINYNELSMPIQNNLGKDMSGESLESIDLQYNVQGQLTHINNPSPGEDDKLFAQRIYYNEYVDKGTPMFNGNIQAIDWKSKTDGVERRYIYEYDRLNRLIQADYEAPTSTLGEDFSVSNISYDANGNILTLTRQGLLNSNTMTFGKMDQLEYQYIGNQLLAVDDIVEDPTDISTKTGNAGDFSDYDDMDNFQRYMGIGAEYMYDLNGNMIEDKNKGIETIVYNHLNLPTDIYFDVANGDYIHNIYTATGTKLRQEIYRNDHLEKQIDYASGIIYEDGKPSSMKHIEGRYLFDVNGKTAYEFHYKDHLGNLRLSFRNPENYDALATMENNLEANEFAHYFTTKSSDRGLLSAHSSKTDQNAPIGLWKSLPITKGDIIKVSAYSFFDQNADPIANSNPLDGVDVQIFVNNTIGSYNIDENGIYIAPPFSLDNLSLGIGVIPTNTSTPSNIPDAGFMLVFYEEGNDDTPVHQEIVYVSTKGTWQLLNSNYTATHTGRVEVFCFNTSDISVYFDNFKVSLDPALIVQENHYYPFGMNLTGIEKQGKPDDKFQWNQMSEKITDFDLDWYHTTYRANDPQLGRWHQVDPKASMMIGLSPYVSMANNPNLMLDPKGDIPVVIPVIAVVGAMIFSTQPVEAPPLEMSSGAQHMRTKAMNGLNQVKGFGLTTMSAGALGFTKSIGVSAGNFFMDILVQTGTNVISTALYGGRIDNALVDIDLADSFMEATARPGGWIGSIIKNLNKAFIDIKVSSGISVVGSGKDTKSFFIDAILGPGNDLFGDTGGHLMQRYLAKRDIANFPWLYQKHGKNKIDHAMAKFAYHSDVLFTKGGLRIIGGVMGNGAKSNPYLDFLNIANQSIQEEEEDEEYVSFGSYGGGYFPKEEAREINRYIRSEELSWQYGNYLDELYSPK